MYYLFTKTYGEWRYSLDTPLPIKSAWFIIGKRKSYADHATTCAKSTISGTIKLNNNGLYWVCIYAQDNNGDVHSIGRALIFNCIKKPLTTTPTSTSDTRQENTTSESLLQNWTIDTLSNRKVAIVPCAFAYNELVNQRPINLSKHLAKKGYAILYVAWQWHPDDTIESGRGEIRPNIYQIGLYEFFDSIHKLCKFSDNEREIFITLPSDNFFTHTDTLASSGWTITYDIMDDWEEFNKVGQATWYAKHIEEAMILRANRVSAVSPRLVNKFAHLRKDISLIPNGFYPNLLGEENKFCALETINSTTIGYFGHLTGAWFDWELLFKCAAALPCHTFEIIGYGAEEIHTTECKKHANIKLIGKIHPSKLKSYVKNWALAIIPFKSTRLVEAVDPIKAYDYLYFGLPFLSQGMPHLSDYPMAQNCNTHEEFIHEMKKKQEGFNKTAVEAFLNEAHWDSRFNKLTNEPKTYNWQHA